MIMLAGRTNNYFAQYNLLPFHDCGRLIFFLLFGTGSLNIISILLSTILLRVLLKCLALLLSFISNERRLFFAEVERCKWTVIIYCLIHNESEFSAEIFFFITYWSKLASFVVVASDWRVITSKKEDRRFPDLTFIWPHMLYSLKDLTTKFISIIITFCLLVCCFAWLLCWSI